jgi:hypothetical protein
MPFPLLAPLVPVAGKLALGAGIGTGISSAVAQIPYLKKRAIKNAATAEEYNPSTGTFRPGYEWDPGDAVKAGLGGYSKDDVLEARQTDFVNRTRDKYAGQREEIEDIFRELGFEKQPRGIKLKPRDNDNIYSNRLDALTSRAAQMEGLQGLLTDGRTLQDLGITPNSSAGDIKAARRKVERADPMSDYQLHLGAQRDLSAARGEQARRFDETYKQRDRIAADEMSIQQQRIGLETINNLQSQLQSLRQHKQQMEALKNNAANTKFNQEMQQKQFKRDGEIYQDSVEYRNRQDGRAEKRRQAEIYKDIFGQIGEILAN